MMARTVKLFGDIVAKENENGKLVVMKGEKVLAPYEYEKVRELTTGCLALRRAHRVDEDALSESDLWSFGVREDILFESGVWFFGARYAYVLDRMGCTGNKEPIAAVGKYGKYVFDERGNLMAFIPDRRPLFFLDDELLVSFTVLEDSPRVKVYDLQGRLLAEGHMNKALEEARRKEELTLRLA